MVSNAIGYKIPMQEHFSRNMQIIELRVFKKMPYKNIAGEFNISAPHIRRIVERYNRFFNLAFVDISPFIIRNDCTDEVRKMAVEALNVLGDYHGYNSDGLFSDEVLSEGVKHDDGKRQYGLLLGDMWEEVGQMVDVLTYGAKKYQPRGWQDVEAKRYVDALYRHLSAVHGGEKLDKESGLPHLAHVAVNAMFLLWDDNNK